MILFRKEIAKVVEGITTLIVPKAELRRGEKGQPTLPKTPIFYNPLMELSRDLSIIVVQIYHLDRDYPLSFCDALAATGARGPPNSSRQQNASRQARSANR